MLDVFDTPTGTTSNIQVFYSSGDWVKPRGVGMVRFLLIGAGGAGSNATTAVGGGGGGSGAITNWIGPAIFVPDALRMNVGAGGSSASDGGATTIVYQQRDSTGYTLLTANGGSAHIPANPSTGGVGATAFTGSPFASSGIWNSTAGQNGASSPSSVAASTTTFVSGGGGGSNLITTVGGGVTGQWGETVATTAAGGSAIASRGRDRLLAFPFYGLGGAGGSTNDTVGTGGGNGGIGSGGGGAGEDGAIGGRGGNGLVIVWAW